MLSVIIAAFSNKKKKRNRERERKGETEGYEIINKKYEYPIPWEKKIVKERRRK